MKLQFTIFKISQRSYLRPWQTAPCLILFLRYFEAFPLFSVVQFRKIFLFLLRDLKKTTKPETERLVSIFIPRKIMLASPYSQPSSISCSTSFDVNVCNYNFPWQLPMIVICHQCTWPVQHEEAYVDIPQAATLPLQSEILQLAFHRKTTTPGHNPILILLYCSDSVESFHVSSVPMLVQINE